MLVNTCFMLVPSITAAKLRWSPSVEYNSCAVNSHFSNILLRSTILEHVRMQEATKYFRQLYL